MNNFTYRNCNLRNNKSCWMIECFLFGWAIKNIFFIIIILRNNLVYSSNNCIVFRKCQSTQRCPKASSMIHSKINRIITLKIGSVSSATISIFHFAKNATGAGSNLESKISKLSILTTIITINIITTNHKHYQNTHL